jgi:hypothetical protein
MIEPVGVNAFGCILVEIDLDWLECGGGVGIGS